MKVKELFEGYWNREEQIKNSSWHKILLSNGYKYKQTEQRRSGGLGNNSNMSKGILIHYYEKNPTEKVEVVVKNNNLYFTIFRNGKYEQLQNSTSETLKKHLEEK